MGLFAKSPFDSLFLQIPLPPTPGEALSKWLQLTPVSFSQGGNLLRHPPPNLVGPLLGSRGLETQGQTLSQLQADRWKNTQERRLTTLAGESTNSPTQFSPQIGPQHGTGFVGNGPVSELASFYPAQLWWEMLNSP